MQHVYILSLWYTLELQILSHQQHFLCLNTRGQQHAGYSRWGGFSCVEHRAQPSSVRCATLIKGYIINGAHI